MTPLTLAGKLWKVQRLVFGHWIGRVFFYQSRVDDQGRPTKLRPVLGPLNQWLMEAGYTVPWTMSRGECHAFWASMANEERFENRPSNYAAKPEGIVDFLHEFWSPCVRLQDSILEVGCNCGVNLDRLRRLGYRKFSGIELNSHALEELQRTFPQLSAILDTHHGSLEEVLPKVPNKSVDIVFSMAVLMHVHPTSNWLFREMARVARKYICTVELEAANCSYIFARNYARVFENLGFSSLSSAMITREAFPQAPPEYDGYVARLFGARDEDGQGYNL